MKKRTMRLGRTFHLSFVAVLIVLLLTGSGRIYADAVEIELEQFTDLAGWEPVTLSPDLLTEDGKIRAPAGTDALNVRLRVKYKEVKGPPEDPPEGFARIPAGEYARGGDSDVSASLPVHDIYVSEFYIADTAVTYEEWNEVYDWAVANEYRLTAGTRGWLDGEGELPDTPENNRHPVVNVSWYDAVKWCNAKSEMEGLTPVYYTKDGGETFNARWGVNGYRLPTEAEWEKAARGGVQGKRYVWGDDPIDATRANYWIESQPPNGTTPVGSYPPNGFGLYDMAGNVWDMCWDGYDRNWYSHPGATEPDSRGPPSSGSGGVARGGSWSGWPLYCRVPYRGGSGSGGKSVGFRLARTRISPPRIETTVVESAPKDMALAEDMVLVDGDIVAGHLVSTFQIGRYEVTWGKWKEVRAWAADNGYALYNFGAGCADEHPVHSVSWLNIAKWCNARSEMEGLTPAYTLDGSVYRDGVEWKPEHGGAVRVKFDTYANGYRLPSDVEWEFAARGGTQKQGYIYSGSNELNEVGWYQGNSSGAVCDLAEGRGTWPVGQKAPNSLGLYDMSGNVSEFLGGRSHRGGSWTDDSNAAHVVAEAWYSQDAKEQYIGFRLARSLGHEGTIRLPTGP